MARKGSLKGKRKYRCCDCGADQFLHWTALIRRFRPRCVRCGSYGLDPVTQEAKEERDIGYRNILAYDEDRGDIVRGDS